MSIRLNKAIRELNIGLQTAVDFLEKKKELGEVKGDLNFKLSDDQYQALVEAFKSDKDVKIDAARLFQKKPKEKKPKEKPAETKVESLVGQNRPQFKPVGKIDLDQLGKKPAAKASVAPEVKPAPAPEAAAVSPEVEVKEPVAEQPRQEQKPVVEEKPAVEASPVAEKAPAVAEQPAVEKAPTPQPEAEKEEGPKPEEQPVAESNEKEIFTTKSENKLLNATKVNVLGKIDLSTINQSTRPKKKSKEERRKEREEKAAQQGERKKRERINKARVDINAAANQQTNAGGNGGGKNGGKKKKNRGRNQKPLEVNEEDVARQVKETLARLTNKSNQNKKGAKYRKEKREAVQEKLSQEARAEQKDSKTLKLTEFVTVSELATMMGISVTQVISTLMSVGIMVSINQRLDAETINLVADEIGFKTEYVSAE
ncbi:MAG: translation initiation factor IF-2 N-terminal domain-containing protein, partial [Prevotella sp.]|nr:translation initiation factor IF-2 N-terminal domain-containing protein [Prevotella sp.]